MNEIETTSNEPYGSAEGKDLVSGRPVFPLEHHEPRRADIDPKAAKRAERQVSAMFAASSALLIAFVVAYVKVPVDSLVKIPGLGTVGTSQVLLGLCFGLGILLIGLGAIHWAKKLMTDVEVTQERHALNSTQEDRDEVAAIVKRGAAESGFGQHKMIRRTLLGALALFPVPLVVMLRDLGPMPGKRLRSTIWSQNVHIVTDATYQKIKASDIPLGGLVNAVPENLMEVEEADGNINARGKASIILVRMDHNRAMAGTIRASLHTQRFARTLAAQSLSINSAHITFFAHATSQLSTSRTQAMWSLVPPHGGCHNFLLQWIAKVTLLHKVTSKNQSDLASGSADEHRN